MSLRLLRSMFGYILLALLPLLHGIRGEVSCDTQCKALLTRFGRNVSQANFNWKKGLKTICTERSLISIAICKEFPRSHIPRIVHLAKEMSPDVLCQEICPIHGKEELDNSAVTLVKLRENNTKKKMKEDDGRSKMKTEDRKKKCKWCKERVNSCATISRILRVPFKSFVNSLCPALYTNLRSDIMCRSVTGEMTEASITVAKDLCSVIDYCYQRKRECPFRSISSADSIFETVFDIVKLISQTTDPAKKTPISELRSSFLVLDESVKCFSPSKKPSVRRRDGRHPVARHFCKPVCDVVPEVVRANIKKHMALSHFHRNQFNELCSEITEAQLKQRCYSLHKLTDFSNILRVLYGKQICQNLECQLFSSYPRYRCNICKLNMRRFRIKKIIQISMETLKTIHQGIEEICSSIRDEKCTNFLTEQNRFFEILKAMADKDTICNMMGFCQGQEDLFYIKQ